MLSNVDRELLQRCLNRSHGAWELFVNRYLGLVVHVAQHTASARSLPMSNDVRDELVSDVFYVLLKDNFAVLRRFRGQSSLATYITVVARRVIVRSLLRKKQQVVKESTRPIAIETEDQSASRHVLDHENRDLVESALAKLSAPEARAVRMFHFEGRSYREIGAELGVTEGSVGPYLTRARSKLRDAMPEKG